MKQRKDSKEKEEKQLDLGIKEPLKNRFFKIKYSIDLSIRKFEVRKFLKDPIVWASLVISIILIAYQGYLIYINYSDLPSYMPVFRYFISIPKKLVYKDYIVMFPVVSIISLILSFFLTSRYYNSEKLLTTILLFTLMLCVLAQSIILVDLIQIF